MQIAKGVDAPPRRLRASTDPAAPAPKECHLVIRDGAIAGRVTSAVRSPALGQVVGLAYLPPDLAAPGSALRDPHRGRPDDRRRGGGDALL